MNEGLMVACGIFSDVKLGNATKFWICAHCARL